MTTKEKIIQTLASLAGELQEVTTYSYLIGASASILQGFEIGETLDIDLLTTSEGSQKLQSSLKPYMEISPLTKEDHLFRSNFARFRLPLLELEVMGDLEVCKHNQWQPVLVQAYQTISIGSLTLRLPTFQEQIRILTLFGREKDLRRIELLKKLSDQSSALS